MIANNIVDLPTLKHWDAKLKRFVVVNAAYAQAVAGGYTGTEEEFKIAFAQALEGGGGGGESEWEPIQLSTSTTK